MEKIRKPMQGIGNIVRFNWHFYVLSVCFLLGLWGFNFYTQRQFEAWVVVVFGLAFFATFISLLVSFYVYDLSGLYELNWLETGKKGLHIVNINAGFDETSVLLAAKFPNARLTVLDFYDPATHTEISIKRARKAYPPFPNTQKIATSHTNLPDQSADKIMLILAAHEIRAEAERVVFFKELGRILKPDGEIYVTEHLRDMPNFLAYNIGFFHFLSKKTWYKTFENADLTLQKEEKITPFIHHFTLKKNGVTT